MSPSEAAEDKIVQVGAYKVAYRLFGRPGGVPLVILPGFRQHMDFWDPLLLDNLAAERQVLLIDSPGVGRSEGIIPQTLAEVAEQYMRTLQALGLYKVDLLGFSMGGYAAQLMVLNHNEPHSLDLPGIGVSHRMPKIRRLILCATESSIGGGFIKHLHTTTSLHTAVTEEDVHEAFMELFFLQDSDSSMRAGEKSWERMRLAREKRGLRRVVDLASSQNQVHGLEAFFHPRGERQGTLSRFEQLILPVLIVNGSKDIFCPTENSIIMWEKLKFANAQLHLYPDSGHGFLFQYPEEFAALVNVFLGAGDAGRKTG